MTQRLLNEIHIRLAGELFWRRVRAGESGDVALRSFADTVQAARQQYWALPRWQRRR